MASSQLSAEEEEALRQMMEETPSTGDARSEGDPDWLANGARIKLFGLKAAAHLNDEKAEVVGFDDGERRYRVRLDSNGDIKKVAKKNLQILPPAPSPPPPTMTRPAAVPQATASSPTVAVASRDFQAQPSTATSSSGAASQVVLPGGSTVVLPSQAAASVSLTPSKETVQRCIQLVNQNVAELQRCCDQRQAGASPEDQDLSDLFLKTNVSVETCTEAYSIYKKEHGDDEELTAMEEKAVETFDGAADFYSEVRSWKEYAQDEWNLTKHNVRKHGILKAVGNEMVELGKDTAAVGKDAAAVAKKGSQHVVAGATKVPVLVRQGTAVGAEVVRRHSTIASEHAGNALHDKFIAPVQRAWKLFLLAVLVDFIFPLFALRAYAPMNSVVSNLGLVYAVVIMICPPKCAQSRRMRAFLLMLWPFFLCVLPIALHYWLMHPPTVNGSQLWSREQLPEAVSQKSWNPVESMPAMPRMQLPSWMPGSGGKAAESPEKGKAFLDLQFARRHHTIDDRVALRAPSRAAVVDGAAYTTLRQLVGGNVAFLARAVAQPTVGVVRSPQLPPGRGHRRVRGSPHHFET